MGSGDADEWWSMPSHDRISLDLTLGVQAFTESREAGGHRLCPTLQSAQDHHFAIYNHRLFWHRFYAITLDVSTSHPNNLLSDLLSRSHAKPLLDRQHRFDLD